MKYNILTLLWIGFFSFYAYAESKKIKVTSTVQNSKKMYQKKLSKKATNNKNRKLQSGSIDTGSFSYDYIDSKLIRNEIEQNIMFITSICSDKNKTLDQKIVSVRRGLKGLRDLADKYLALSHNLSTPDYSLFLGMKDLISQSNISNGKNITKELITKDLNLKDSFVSYYRFFYKLPENTETQKFSWWASQIADGLGCLYQ